LVERVIHLAGAFGWQIADRDKSNSTPMRGHHFLPMEFGNIGGAGPFGSLRCSVPGHTLANPLAYRFDLTGFSERAPQESAGLALLQGIRSLARMFSCATLRAIGFGTGPFPITTLALKKPEKHCCGMFGRLLPLVLSAVLLLAAGCRRHKREINLYVDPEPHMTYWAMWYFTQEFHIVVKQFHNPVISPATFVERLTAERDHPQADVYWCGDPIYCEILHERGLTVPARHQFQIPREFQSEENHWTGVVARARVLLVRQSLGKNAPQSIRAYTDPMWWGKGALADPLSGTTRSHFAALSVLWGDRELAAFYDALRKNGTRITKDNEESAALVAKGEAEFALVDIDVALKQIDTGSPVEIIYPDQGKNDIGVMMIPNALSIIKGCKDLDAAQKLIDFLTSVENEVRLIRFEQSYNPLENHTAILSPYVRHIEALRLLPVDYAAAAKKLPEMGKILGTGQKSQ
jgi:iron(III) transport system substrate-binding protein